jgi:outer membrane protein OmpA-like peptidoglycan-associated protein
MTLQPPWRWPLWRRWPGRVLIALAVLALCWTSLGWWLPGVLKPRIEAAASEALGTPVTLQRLALQPWTLKVEAGGLQVGPAEAPLFKLAEARTQLALSSVWHRAPVLRSLALNGPQLWVQRLEAQRFNFTPVLEHLRRPAPTPPQDSEPARFALHNISLRGGAVFYDDRVLHSEHRIEALTLAVPFISNLPSDVRTEVQPALSARIDGSQFKLDGGAQPFAPDRPATLQLDWQGLQLTDWAPLVEALLPPEQAPKLTRGQLDTHLQITFQDPSGPTPARLRVQGRVAVQDLQVGLPSVAVDARWQALQVDDLDLAPLEQRYRIGSVTLRGLEADVRRTAPAPAPPTAKTPPAAAPAASAASAPAAAATLQWQVDRLHCEACQVRWHDGTVQPAVQLALQQATLTAGPLSQDLSKPIDIELAGRLGGPLKLKAQVQPQPLKGQVTLDLDGFALAPLQPYLAPHVNLRLIGGQAGAAGQLVFDSPGPTLRYRGRVAVSGLKTQDGVTGTDFVAWRLLAFDDLDLRLPAGTQPPEVDLGRVRLDGLRARVILHPDAHLNLADVPKRSPAEAVSLTSPGTAASAPATPRPAPASAERPRLRWRNVAIADGNVHFTDNFIRPNYSAQLTRLQGQISALDATRPEPARVSLTGALDDGAPVRIAGSVHPLAQPLYLDMEGSARGIALTKLSAYSARYAGYTIDKGTLTMTVRYHVEQGKLDAENQLFLDQFNFGEKVDSPEATSLPVRLAVALLKNRRGEIDVRLPITGTLDDPQFSVGSLLWRAFVNLLTRVATAPFALLGGGDAGSLDRVDFAAGSAELDDAARKGLDKLAGQLEERPELKLDITGFADPVRDAAPPPAATTAASGAAAPAQAASAAATAASAPLDPARLQTLADARADRVLAYLAGRIDPQRLLLARSRLEAAEGPAGTGVVLGLR